MNNLFGFMFSRHTLQPTRFSSNSLPTIMRRKLFLISSVALLLGVSASAQEVLTPSGGDDSGYGGMSCCTIGQCTYQELSSSSNSVAEGVQCRYVISIPTVFERQDIKLSTSVFPNPTVDILTLQVESDSFDGISCHLYDLSGNHILMQNVSAKMTKINMSAYPPASYIISVLHGKKELKSFKISKQ